MARIRFRKSKTKPKHFVVIGGGVPVTVRGKGTAQRIVKIRKKKVKEIGE